MREQLLAMNRLGEEALSESGFSCCQAFGPPTDAFDQRYASRHSIYCTAQNKVYSVFVIYVAGDGTKPEEILKHEIITTIIKEHK